ncbi:hypothetical protein HV192_01080 [Klebsiella oxytoca]|nr:hypothetical protein HV192_01080 [Klebsiella oxytoca]
MVPAYVSVWASCVAGANAWQQEYIAIDTKSNTADAGGQNRAQDGAWRDVTFGADMSLNSHLAAWAALSQADNLPTGANYLYLMGVSANF